LFGLFSRDSAGARRRPGNLAVSLLLILASEPQLLVKVNILFQFLVEKMSTRRRAATESGIVRRMTRITQKGMETESRIVQIEPVPMKFHRFSEIPTRNDE